MMVKKSDLFSTSTWGVGVCAPGVDVGCGWGIGGMDGGVGCVDGVYGGGWRGGGWGGVGYGWGCAWL